MSLVTACPACATSFKVQLAQLATRNGKVRCGKCGTVFNAMEKLAEPQDTSPAIEDKPRNEDNVYTYTLIDRTIEPDKLAPEEGATNEQHEHGDNIHRNFKHNWLLLSLIFLLMLSAALQTVYHLRSSISAKWPLAKPYLLQTCELLGCKVELPRQSELLTIDDSDLQEDPQYQGLLRFSSTIINNANFTQAYPSLELTLTDTNDQPVLRRIFIPKEYLPVGTDVAKGLASDEEVKVRLALSIANENVAGYRAYITYAR